MSTTDEFEVTTETEQRYVGVRGTVQMDHFAPIADRLPGLIGQVAATGAMAGPPFLRYRVIDLGGDLQVEAGVPVSSEVEPAEEEAFLDVLPAGRYVATTHTGPFDELVELTARLLAWAEGQGLVFDVRDSDDGEVWGCRCEFYLTDPSTEPDPARFQTRLAFRLAD